MKELKEVLQEAQGKLEDEETTREEVEEESKDAEAKLAHYAELHRELKDQLKLLKVECEAKNTKKLSDEVATLDEEISILTTAKQAIKAGHTKSEEDQQAGEERLRGLLEVKRKLEGIKEEMEESLEVEKRGKQDAEKERKTLEIELKAGKLAVHTLHREKEERDQELLRLDTEIASCTGKLEEEESAICRNQAFIRELQARVEATENDLDREKHAKLAAEHRRSDLAREAEQLTDSLEESITNSRAQGEINAKLEAKMQELKKDAEENSITCEATLLKLRRKHQEAYDEMSAQTDVLRKMKTKTERDMLSAELEIRDTSVGQERAMQDVALGERHLKDDREKLNKLERRVREEEAGIKDLEDDSRKLTASNAGKLNEFDVLQQKANLMAGEKAQLTALLVTATRECEAEERERVSLLARYHTLEHEYDGIKEQYDDEQMEKENFLNLLDKAGSDILMWKRKFEREVVQRLEDLEATKMKLQARLVEAEDVMESLSKKLQIEEERKTMVSKNLEEVHKRLDLASCILSQAERCIKQQEREVVEWKVKAETLGAELGSAQAQCRETATELFRVKVGSEESAQKMEDVSRENQALAGEILDLGEQIRDGGRNIHKIDKQRKSLEGEKGELTMVLQEVEAALEEEETKLGDLTKQVEEMKRDLERKVLGMEEAFVVTKANHSKTMERLRQEVESQSKAKAEAMRARQVLDQSVLELESALGRSQLKCVELQVLA